MGIIPCVRFVFYSGFVRNNAVHSVCVVFDDSLLLLLGSQILRVSLMLVGNASVFLDIRESSIAKLLIIPVSFDGALELKLTHPNVNRLHLSVSISNYLVEFPDFASAPCGWRARQG